MKVEVLISCMHQTDASIITRTNVQSDVLIINQCDKDEVEEYSFLNKKGEECHARIIHTTERGLSRSRNMAIRNATGDVCLVCDDDEILEDDYSEKIACAFIEHPQADILSFIVKSHRKSYFPSKEKTIGYIGAMKTSSYQITFRRNAIIQKNVRFDEKMGSGTGNGGGEEIRFLFDCLNRRLKMCFIPCLIGSVSHAESQWFKGFTKTYFLDRGWASKKILGVFGALLYDCYFAVTKYRLYSKEMSFFNALFCMLRGSLQYR